MDLFKNPYMVIAGIIVCLILFYLANTGKVFGRFINHLSPCVQNPANSFPCFGIYDIAIMILAVVIGVIFIGIFNF